MHVVSCSFEHHAGDNTICLGSTPIFRENIRRLSEASHLSSPSTNLTRRLAARWYLEYPNAKKALYIYKYPCFLQDFNPGSTTQQSASLTTIPDGQQTICTQNFPSLVSEILEVITAYFCLYVML
ncbi:uncharacterized protein TNCV_2371061 [Trichonephila clavipes]|nr:uncharacterized protein TNCV_2371061 [Trichonephila clavipes]